MTREQWKKAERVAKVELEGLRSQLRRTPARFREEVADLKRKIAEKNAEHMRCLDHVRGIS